MVQADIKATERSVGRQAPERVRLVCFPLLGRLYCLLDCRKTAKPQVSWAFLSRGVWRRARQSHRSVPLPK